MATMLLQLVDETDPDFYVNAGLPKRGDVLRLHDGGPESFGPAFHADPALRIVPVEGTVPELSPLLEAEPVGARTRHFRAVCLDPDTIVDGMAAADVLACLTRRPRLTDPAMFLAE